MFLNKNKIKALNIKLFFFTFIFVFNSCYKINIPPPQIILNKINITKTHNNKKVKIIITSSSNIETKRWVKALSISRLFFRGIKNESGSIKNLLEPKIKEIIINSGYVLYEENSETLPDLILNINIEKNILIWLPPFEFIQTPSPSRKGEIRLDFKIITNFSDLVKTNYNKETETTQNLNNPSNNESNNQSNNQSKKLGNENYLYVTKQLWNTNFEKKETLLVYPGQEVSQLEILAHQTLQRYIIEIQNKIRDFN